MPTSDQIFLGYPIWIEPLKSRHDVKVRLNYLFATSLVYWHWFEYSTHVSYITHDMCALGVAQKIQVIGSL